MNLIITTLHDGDNEPIGLREIVLRWQKTWAENYQEFSGLGFEHNFNLKNNETKKRLSPNIKQITEIRNPDIFFLEKSHNLPLGGVEITVHSPDGSNVEKRYPYLWASRRSGIDGFVACPYSKTRPSGMVNKLPYRHAFRNLQFLNEWNPEDGGKSAIHQIIPTVGLQTDWDGISKDIAVNMITWGDLGDFFAHSLAKKVLTGKPNKIAVSNGIGA